MLEHYDKQIAASLEVVIEQTAPKAKRLAAKGEAVLSDQKSRKYLGNFVLQLASNNEPHKR